MSYATMIFSPPKNKFLSDIQLILVSNHVDYETRFVILLFNRSPITNSTHKNEKMQLKS